MKRRFVLAFIFCLHSVFSYSQNVRQLVGKNYIQLSDIKGFGQYKLVKEYKVFDEMECVLYNDTLTYSAIMVFRKKVDIGGQAGYKVSDVLKIDQTGRHEILVVGNNKYGAHSASNIIIVIEEIAEDGAYVNPPRSIKIVSAYTLEHKTYEFVKVPLKGLYRIGENFFKERTAMY